MSERPLRIAMWSGPRNISTAMMRAFGARADTAVVDEPLYAAYLRQTGLVHPLTAEILASQPHDWQQVVEQLLGPVPEDKSVFYQKHMTHHLLPSFGRDWLEHVHSAFLIRDPASVLASYIQKRTDVTLDDIGIVQQSELFDHEAQRLGRVPVVIDSADVLANPASVLAQLCAALGLTYTDTMLRWPAGLHATDGVWAPAWYGAVERSTGFEPQAARAIPKLPGELQKIAERAAPHYAAMARHRLH